MDVNKQNSQKTTGNRTDVLLTSSQPASSGPDVTVNRRRQRVKSVDNLYDLPAAKNARFCHTQSSGYGIEHHNVSGSSSQQGAKFFIPQSKQCTNKQLLEAINALSMKLTARIDTVEQSLAQRIQDMETTLENKLLTSLNAKVDSLVQQAATDIRSEVNERLAEVQNTKAETAAIKEDI